MRDSEYVSMQPDRESKEHFRMAERFMTQWCEDLKRVLHDADIGSVKSNILEEQDSRAAMQKKTHSAF